MTRDEKAAEARRLRAEGLPLRQIAERLGYAGSSGVWVLLHPDEAKARGVRDNARRAAAKRAWENEHNRRACPCGALMGARADVCRACHDEMVAVGRAMREEQIAELWSQGYKLREIAAALDSNKDSVRCAMAKMRRSGWDLPRRYNWTPEGLERAQNAGRAA